MDLSLLLLYDIKNTAKACETDFLCFLFYFNECNCKFAEFHIYTLLQRFSCRINIGKVNFELNSSIYTFFNQNIKYKHFCAGIL